MTIERVRKPASDAEVLAYLEGREPETTAALVSVNSTDRPRDVRVWAVRKGGQLAGLLVSSKWCRDRWSAQLFLDDLGAADDMAQALDKSNAWAVSGPVDGVEAVLRRARRAKGWVQVWFYWIAPQPPDNGDAFPRNEGVTIRDASPADLDALVEIYSLDEHSGGVTRPRLREAIRNRLPHLRVAEVDSDVVGALFAPETRRYRVFDMLAVHPKARGRRLGMAMLIDAGTDAVIKGVGVCGERAMTNGMRVSHDDVLSIGEANVWAAADLFPPRLFRGQGRLRRLVARLEGGVITPPRPELSPHSVLPGQTVPTANVTDADDAAI